MNSSDPNIITRRETEKNDLNESAGWSSKMLREKEEVGEGYESADHADFPGIPEGLKDSACYEWWHMLTWKRVRWVYQKAIRKCVNFRCLGRCSNRWETGERWGGGGRGGFSWGQERNRTGKKGREGGDNGRKYQTEKSYGDGKWEEEGEVK